MSFAEAAALSLLDDDSGNTGQVANAPRRFATDIPEGWDIVGNTNGGFMMALLAKAAREVSGRPDVVSLAANFLAPGVPGSAEVHVNTVKSGRRFDTSRADLVIDRTPRVIATVTTGDLDDGESSSMVKLTPPSIPGPDECERVPATELFPPPLMSKIDLRLHPEEQMGNPAGTPAFRGWFQLLDDEPMDSVTLTMATDVTPPTVFNTEIGVGWSPTVQMTTYVRRRPTTPWILIHTHSRVVENGMFETDAVLYDQAGLVLAQGRQLQLIKKA